MDGDDSENANKISHTHVTERSNYFKSATWQQMGNSDINHTEKSHRYRLLPSLSPGRYSHQLLDFNPGDKVSLLHGTQDWKKATSLRVKTNMADSCIKSRPVSTRRGTPTELLNANSEQDQTNVFEGQIFFQPPDNSINPKRGLSGSRLHRNSLISKARSQSSRRSDISHATQQDDVPETPYTRPPSLRLSARLSKGLQVNKVDHSLNNYRWNNSDQAMRFQLQLYRLNTCRTIKRYSEAMQRFMDPKYCLFGSKLPLLNRFGSDNHKTEWKRSCEPRAHNSTLQPIQRTPTIKDVPLCRWTGDTNPTDGLDNSNSIAKLTVEKLNSTCYVSESSNVALESGPGEADPEEEVTNIFPRTSCSGISQETESTGDHEHPASSDLIPEIQYGGTGNSDAHLQTGYGEIRRNEVKQETESDMIEFSEVNQEIQFGEVSFSEVSKTESVETGFGGANQESESNEIGFSGVNKETESDEVGFSVVNQDAESDEIGFSVVNQDTESDEVGFSVVNQDAESDEIGFSDVNKETEYSEVSRCGVIQETESDELVLSKVNQEM
ncbi:hypothetical protein BsWGS_16142 [Bradybaena similaris]